MPARTKPPSAGIGEDLLILSMPLSLPKALRRHTEDFFFLRSCMVDNDHAKLSGDECSASVPLDADGQMDQARPTEEFIYRDSVISRYIGALICGIMALQAAGRF